jgi:peptidoglycan-associated lipoprotein
MREVLFTIVSIFLLALSGLAQSANPQPGVPAYVPPQTPQAQSAEQSLKDVHFDFDRSDLTSEDQQTLQANADWLKSNPGVYITIAGEADDRGSIFYNVVLSQQRADATRQALISMGVPADRIVFATGWGKLYPVCNQDDESCWAQNRRAHFEPWQAGSLSASKQAPVANQSTRASLIK